MSRFAFTRVAFSVPMSDPQPYLVYPLPFYGCLSQKRHQLSRCVPGLRPKVGRLLGCRQTPGPPADDLREFQGWGGGGGAGLEVTPGGLRVKVGGILREMTKQMTKMRWHMAELPSYYGEDQKERTCAIYFWQMGIMKGMTHQNFESVPLLSPNCRPSLIRTETRCFNLVLRTQGNWVLGWGLGEEGAGGMGWIQQMYCFVEILPK